MSSTTISAGERSADLGVYERGLQDEAAASRQPVAPAREKWRPRRGRLGQVLLLSLGLVTLAGCGSVVAAAILASGSARPTDWRQVNWGLVAGRYQSCRQEPQSRGPFGCLASIGPRADQSSQPQQRGVVYVTAPITASAPGATAAPPAQSSAASGATAPGAARPGAGATPGAVVSQPPAAAPPPVPVDDSGRGRGGGGGDD